MVRRSRNLLDQFADPGPQWHGLLASILLSTNIDKDVKQTLGIPSVTRFTALKIAKKSGYPCWMLNESTWFKGKCTLFYSWFGNWRRLGYKILAYEVCIICPKLIAACKIHYKSPAESTVRWSHHARLFHGPWSDPFGLHKESAYVRSHVGCRRVHQTLLLPIQQIFQRQKSDANKHDF